MANEVGTVVKWVKGAHVFFWLVLAAALPAVAAAALSSAREPSWALESKVVYRLELGLAVFAAGYLVALTLCLSYKGRSFGRVSFPGGEVETQDPALQEAAEGATSFQEETRGSISELTDALATLNTQVASLQDQELGARIASLEDRRLGERLAKLEDRAE